jgi:hypothetical protein
MSMANGGAAAYTATPETEAHIVIKADRSVVVPDELKRIAVQYDHNVETVTFDCPRFWDEHDLSAMDVHINYELPNGRRDEYEVINKNVDENDATVMHFDWCISKDVTRLSGAIKFSVCIKYVDENGEELVHWNSEVNKDLYISEGICSEVNN